MSTGDCDRYSALSRFMVQRRESQSNKDEMTDSPPCDLDRRDWAARASEALAQAEELPPDAMQSHQKRRAASPRSKQEGMADTETANGTTKTTG
jgi:hypothetical protein